MSVIISNAELYEAIEQKSFIKNGAIKRLEDIKYDFALSNDILKAQFRRPVDFSKLTQGEQADMRVMPGEVVFVLSEESIELPLDIYVSLSPKRKMSQEGIVTLTGFTLDPGYKGRILLGFYNISSTAFDLMPGQKMIGAHFFRLNESEKKGIKGNVEVLNGFPPELQKIIEKYQPTNLKEMANLHEEIKSLREKVDGHNKWKDMLEKHESTLVRIEETLEKMTKLIEKEATVRDKNDKSIEKRIDPLEKQSWQNNVLWVILITVVLAAAGLLGWFINVLLTLANK